jgi:hypothetical protein
MILYFPLHFWSFNRSIYPIVTDLVRLHPEYSLYTISKIVIATAWQSHLIATTFFNPESLWFLYYLLIFCLLNILLIRCKFSWSFFNNRYWAIIFSLVLNLCCFTGKTAFLPTPNSLIPSLQLLLCYGLFYFLGWQAYHHKNIFNYAMKYLWVWLFIALFAAIGYFLSIFAFFCYGFLVTGISIFLIGFFQKYLSRKNKVLSYFSSISYWCYLIRVPSLCVLQYGLVMSTLPISIQLLFAFFGSLLISVISIEIIMWFVKKTPILSHLILP